jgi:hypothetical protein
MFIQNILLYKLFPKNVLPYYFYVFVKYFQYYFLYHNQPIQNFLSPHQQISPRQGSPPRTGERVLGAVEIMLLLFLRGLSAIGGQHK